MGNIQIEDIDFTEDLFYLLHFDLPNEGVKHFPKDVKRMCNRQRLKIWSYLKRIRCIPLSNSVYRIMTKEQLDLLTVKVEEWREEYMSFLDLNGDGHSNFLSGITGLPIEPKIEICPLLTDDKTHKLFVDQEADFLLAWVLRIQKKINDLLENDKKISRIQINNYKDSLRLIRESLDMDLKEHKHYDHIKNNIVIADDLIAQLILRDKAKEKGKPSNVLEL